MVQLNISFIGFGLIAIFWVFTLIVFIGGMIIYDKMSQYLRLIKQWESTAEDWIKNDLVVCKNINTIESNNIMELTAQYETDGDNDDDEDGDNDNDDGSENESSPLIVENGEDIDANVKAIISEISSETETTNHSFNNISLDGLSDVMSLTTKLTAIITTRMSKITTGLAKLMTLICSIIGHLKDTQTNMLTRERKIYKCLHKALHRILTIDRVIRLQRQVYATIAWYHDVAAETIRTTTTESAVDEHDRVKLWWNLIIKCCNAIRLRMVNIFIENPMLSPFMAHLENSFEKSNVFQSHANTFAKRINNNSPPSALECMQVLCTLTHLVFHTGETEEHVVRCYLPDGQDVFVLVHLYELWEMVVYDIVNKPTNPIGNTLEDNQQMLQMILDDSNFLFS